MVRTTRLIGGCLAVCVGVLASTATLAQSEDDEGIEVIPLQYLPLNEVIPMLEQAFGGHFNAITGIERENALVLKGPAAARKSAIDFVRKLDRPKEAAVERITKLIPVPTYPIDEMVILVEQAIGVGLANNYSRVAVDPVNRRLVVTAPIKDVEDAQRIVSELDKGPNVFTVQLSFLSGQTSKTGGTGTSVPESMKNVAVALEKQGFLEAEMLAPFTIRSESGHEFTAVSNLEMAGAFSHIESLEFKVEGAATGLADQQNVQLTITAEMRGGGPTDKGPNSRSFFQLDTTVSLPLNKQVVLAVSPSSTQSSSAMALVLQVTRD